MSSKAIIVYASNSGATFLVAETIARVLKRRLTVTIQKSADTKPADLKKYDILIFGSPSWDIVGRGNGLPQETMLDFIESCAGQKFPGKLCAAFGCGDSSYSSFCAAVYRLEKLISDLEGKRVVDSLRIDGYFFNLKENSALAESWAKNLLKHLI